ncbi:hypothetical protein FACS189454_07830 [Planctomycetales bacterium]|nr:hypothetical protein FACS189454_07830 [Planctomycetales bacterium]
MSEPVIGIDLGTTFFAVATIDEHGRAVVLRNSEGRNITPSVITFAPDSIKFGAEAKSIQADGDTNVASFFKRRMGDADYVLEFFGKEYNSQDLSALLLKKLKEDAELVLGQKVAKAVITVPAYFDACQWTATVQAGKIAGLNVIAIISEPVAAAINYGLNADTKGQNIIVYDLGGGTFDVTVVRIGEDLDKTKIVVTDGDHQLGGYNWNEKIINYCQEQCNELTGCKVEDPEELGKLQVDAEEKKMQLSQENRVFFVIQADSGKVKFELTREQFDEMTSDLLEQTFVLTDKLLADAEKHGITKFDAFLLVGGATLMPQVAAKVKEKYAAKLGIAEPVYLDYAVARGAAVYGFHHIH